eukprot:TRINITY_DN267_c0_g1_i3.p1 TRINITY_DN267_c0_g1~~TRINITY_DN267_c0_g1_i3.p1  ORF type:complete len:694 (+),score=299.14 TRINITY_DN267_c0_g1_i3:257-2338(+)
MANRTVQPTVASASNASTAEETMENRIIHGLDNPTRLEDLIVRPNATRPEDVVTVANRDMGDLQASDSVIGKLIDQGKIGLINWNGKIQVVGPGRYILSNPRAHWEDEKSITDSPINHETLTIFRVNRGELGLGTNAGQPLVFGEGLHVYNDRLFSFIELKDINQQYIQHGSIHIIRVPKGSYAAVTDNNVPKLLPEGVHVTNSNVFSFNGMQSTNQVYIQHGTLHIVRVAKGNVALVTDNNNPTLLPEGTHYINSNTFNYFGVQDLNQQVIKHGTICRFRVRKGEIGLAWDNNQPQFYEEGIYEKDSSNFQFEKCVDASDKVIVLGARKIVTVWDGEVGVSYKKGKLHVLRPDRHQIDTPEHIFQGFLSTQQQCLHLYEEVSRKGPQRPDWGLAVCETKDFVELGIKADVFFRIVQPERALLIVGKDSILPLVRETSIATLNGIIRSTSLAEVAQNKEVTVVSERKQAEHMVPSESGASAPLFFDKVHDEFISKLHDVFVEKYGIEVTNIRIESFKILNEELSSNISKQALTTAQTETQLANLAGQTEIAVAQQMRDQEVLKIRVQSAATQLNTETISRNQAVTNTAKTDAESTLIRARAEAEALMVRAEADAKAIRVKAQAEGERATVLDKTALGGQMAMFQLYADMMQKSMQGIDKVVYLPTTENQGAAGLLPMMGMLPSLMASQASAKK